jgi:hypothetical protein
MKIKLAFKLNFKGYSIDYYEKIYRLHSYSSAASSSPLIFISLRASNVARPNFSMDNSSEPSAYASKNSSHLSFSISLSNFFMKF